MLVFIIYLLVIFLLLFFLIGVTIYTLSLIGSSFAGSPYVPTRKKEIENILKEADLKKDKLFIELGCGDGRVLREAIKKYQVKGVGVDINPLLIFWARFLSSKIKDKAVFKVENIFDTSLKKADYLYLFLMPKLIEKLTPKMEKELKKGAIIISHGFAVKAWSKKLYKKLDSNPFPTYYYRV